MTGGEGDRVGGPSVGTSGRSEPASGIGEEDLIALAVEAIGDRDAERLLALMGADAAVITPRGVNRGPEEIAAWVSKSFDHLDRRFVVDRLEPRSGAQPGGENPGGGAPEEETSLAASGRVDHVWRESQEIGDSTPVAFSFRIASGRITELVVHDDLDAARAWLRG